MKQIFIISLTLCLLAAAGSAVAQDPPVHPTVVRGAIYFDVSAPVTDMHGVLTTEPNTTPGEVPNRPGKPAARSLKSALQGGFEDPVWQNQEVTHAAVTAGPLQNFEGINNLTGVYPPDVQGDASTDKYLQVVNCKYAVYSKTGTLLAGPFDLSTIWTGIPSPWNSTNNGDPIVLFDQAAGRWMISQFSLPNNTQYAMTIAVSATSDPTGSWYRYVFEFGAKMPDYPKFGVWQDGYYMSINQFIQGNSWGGVGACAFERQKMLAGDPTAKMIYFDLGVYSHPWSMLPADWDGATTPFTGEMCPFIYYDDWTSSDNRYLKIWSMSVNWTVPSLSTFGETGSLAVAPFTGDICPEYRGRCIPQPNTTRKLESLADRLMYRLQYRNFGTYASMVTNHTVNVDGNGRAGIRWYELRSTGGAWSLYQQGTFSPDATNRWMGSIAMDAQGDIALGYSVSSGSLFPSIRYTGRKANDEPGVMTFPEQTVINGTGSQTGSACRWGDYSMMSVDPADDKTFWYTQEYLQTTGTAPWRTRVASFILPDPPSVVPLPATAITTNSATLNGNVCPNGLATNWYFQYGTTTAYGQTTSVLPAGAGTAPLAVNAAITGLTPGVTIHYRLVAVNADGTSSSSDRTFIPGGVTLTTLTPYSISLNSAASGGNISSNGGSAVTSRGICWSTSANPTISDSHTSDGAGNGIYPSTMTGLTGSTEYHVRAYATNGAGTFYGNDVTFTTVCGSFTLPFSEDFSETTQPPCWTQVDHAGNGQVWDFGRIISFTPAPTLTGNYAFLDSDGFGNGYTQNADLITPTLNLSNYGNVTLTFNHYFRQAASETGSVWYSLDNGENWTLIASFNYTTGNPATFSQSVPQVNEQPLVRFKWNYTGYYGWCWGIDNVSVTGMAINAQVSNVNAGTGSVLCYNASQTVTLAGSGSTFQVQNGGQVTVIAGSRIYVEPGTKVFPGGYLHGLIAPTGPFCTYPSNAPESNALSGQVADLAPADGKNGALLIRPNPTRGRFTIGLPAGIDESQKITLTIYNAMGHLVMQNITEGLTSREFSLENYPAGVYFVQVHGQGFISSARIIRID